MIGRFALILCLVAVPLATANASRTESCLLKVETCTLDVTDSCEALAAQGNPQAEEGCCDYVLDFTSCLGDDFVTCLGQTFYDTISVAVDQCGGLPYKPPVVEPIKRPCRQALNRCGRRLGQNCLRLTFERSFGQDVDIPEDCCTRASATLDCLEDLDAEQCVGEALLETVAGIPDVCAAPVNCLLTVERCTLDVTESCQALAAHGNPQAEEGCCDYVLDFTSCLGDDFVTCLGQTFYDTISVAVDQCGGLPDTPPVVEPISDACEDALNTCGGNLEADCLRLTFEESFGQEVDIPETCCSQATATLDCLGFNAEQCVGEALLETVTGIPDVCAAPVNCLLTVERCTLDVTESCQALAAQGNPQAEEGCCDYVLDFTSCLGDDFVTCLGQTFYDTISVAVDQCGGLPDTPPVVEPISDACEDALNTCGGNLEADCLRLTFEESFGQEVDIPETCCSQATATLDCLGFNAEQCVGEALLETVTGIPDVCAAPVNCLLTVERCTLDVTESCQALAAQGNPQAEEGCCDYVLDFTSCLGDDFVTCLGQTFYDTISVAVDQCGGLPDTPPVIEPISDACEDALNTCGGNLEADCLRLTFEESFGQEVDIPETCCSQATATLDCLGFNAEQCVGEALLETVTGIPDVCAAPVNCLLTVERCTLDVTESCQALAAQGNPQAEEGCCDYVLDFTSCLGDDFVTCLGQTFYDTISVAVDQCGGLPDTPPVVEPISDACEDALNTCGGNLEADCLRLTFEESFGQEVDIPETCCSQATATLDCLGFNAEQCVGEALLETVAGIPTNCE